MTRELLSLIMQAKREGVGLSDAENFILDLLCNHLGRANAIEGAVIREQAMDVGLCLDRRALSDIVATLIDKHRIPIGTSKGKPAGYFLTVTDEDQEIAAAELWAQIRPMIRRAMVLSPKTRHGRELLGQLQAELDSAEAVA